MKQRLLSLCILILLILSGCQNTSVEREIFETDEMELYNFQPTYLGDSSTVVHMMGLLEYPSGLVYDHIELKTDESPYVLSLYLSGTEADRLESKDAFVKIGYILFPIIENLDQIVFVLEGVDGVPNYLVERQSLALALEEEWPVFRGGDDFNKYLDKIDKEVLAEGDLSTLITESKDSKREQ